MTFKYRESNYFNSESTYVFKTWREWESKVEFVKGAWYTVESLEYKAMTVECYVK